MAKRVTKKEARVHRRLAVQARLVPHREIETIGRERRHKALPDRRLNTAEGRGVEVQVGITVVVTQGPARGIIVVNQNHFPNLSSQRFQGCSHNEVLKKFVDFFSQFVNTIYKSQLNKKKTFFHEINAETVSI